MANYKNERLSRSSQVGQAAGAKQRPTVAQLQAALNYDPGTGKFSWKYRADRGAGWNTRRAGTSAGCLDGKGYHVIGVDGFYYRSHRLAVLFMTGEWPSECVDHIDLNRANNAWSNLRTCSRSENGGNRRVRPDAISGLKGA